MFRLDVYVPLKYSYALEYEDEEHADLIKKLIEKNETGIQVTIKEVE